MRFPVIEYVVKTPRHTTFYLSCGAEGAAPIIFLHGWPELSASWRHQLQCFGALGFRAIAPDMRGYGRSTVHRNVEDYAMEPIVADMIELVDALAVPSAVWVGHDWGAPVVWSLAQHHPSRVSGVASLCVPYFPEGFAPKNFIGLVDRNLYPLEQYPAGQWDYQLFYEESFAKACATFEANVLNTVKALFRKGNPAGTGKPAPLATVRRQGGWFKGANEAPDLPIDRDLLTEEDLHRYSSALEQNGFFGPNAWYVNGSANVAFARLAPNGFRLSTPVLFFHAAYDYTCATLHSALADPMRQACNDLTELTVPTGHWMAQERPELVNAGLARWLALKFPQHWAV